MTDQNEGGSAAMFDTGGNSDREMGARLRAIRKARGLSLKDVSEGSGSSLGALSQIERGVSSPSIKALRSICTVLDVPVSSLFSGEEGPGEEQGIIVRKWARRRLDFHHKGMAKELLTSGEEGGIQLMEVILDVGAGSGDQPYSHAGEEVGVVLAGQMSLWIDGRRYDLGTGDAFRFDSPRPHRFVNNGNTEARVLWMVTEAFY
ncbi:cupin domain-containing protein [Stappia stellulata]|uniref:cupin domain-containing protein n=1 Tax=Stappia stellulata TaxID=71235 RepID=UPI0004285078|nr:cupin domain-containing protein [Stappia stellulata]